MTKQRHNVGDIAEILIDEIDLFKKSAESIKQSTERLQQTKVSISKESILELTNLLQANKKNQEEFAIHLANVTSENSMRVPNWVIAMIVALFFTLTGYSVYMMKRIEYVKVLEVDLEYYKTELDNANSKLDNKQINLNKR